MSNNNGINQQGCSTRYPMVLQDYNCNDPSRVVPAQNTVEALPQMACKDYIEWSLVSLLFFNPILGIVATVFSCKTMYSFNIGDYASAAVFTRKVLIFNAASLILGVIMYATLLFLFVYRPPPTALG